MSTREAVDILAADGVIDAELFYPATPGQAPAVLLLTDIRGTRPVFAAMAERLAQAGYAVLLPNLYYRGGRAPVVDPSLPMTDADTKARRGALRAALTPAAQQADIGTLLAWLAAVPRVRPGAVGIVGYCMSGGFALRAAADFPGRIAAAASFHGGSLASDAEDSPHRRLGDIRARLYIGHADADASMPPEAIARLDAALAESGLRYRTDVYSGARHGFAVADGQAYQEAAAERHWRELLALFASELQPAAAA